MYRREFKRKKQIQTNLFKEKRFLRLALEGGNTYAWKLENELFIFENDFFTANQMAPRKISLTELLSITHPDDQGHLRSHIQDIYSGIWEETTIQCRFNFNRERLLLVGTSLQPGRRQNGSGTDSYRFMPEYPGI